MIEGITYTPATSLHNYRVHQNIKAKSECSKSKGYSVDFNQKSNLLHCIHKTAVRNGNNNKYIQSHTSLSFVSANTRQAGLERYDNDFYSADKRPEGWQYQAPAMDPPLRDPRKSPSPLSDDPEPLKALLKQIENKDVEHSKDWWVCCICTKVNTVPRGDAIQRNICQNVDQQVCGDRMKRDLLFKNGEPAKGIDHRDVSFVYKAVPGNHERCEECWPKNIRLWQGGRFGLPKRPWREFQDASGKKVKMW